MLWQEYAENRPPTDAELRREARESARQRELRLDEIDRFERGIPQRNTLLWSVYRMWTISRFCFRYLRVSLLWLVLFLLLGRYALALLAVLVIVAVVMSVRGHSPEKLRLIRGLLPVIADFKRVQVQRQQQREVEIGNQLLRQFRFVPDSDETMFNARFIDGENPVWIFSLPISGATRQTVTAKIEDGLSILHAADYDLEVLGNSEWLVTFYAEKRQRFLDSGQTITQPLQPDLDFVSGQQHIRIPIAFNEQNQVRTLDFDSVAGCVVGGVPGSGKSAMLNTLLAPLVATDKVRVSIIDGKGGADLEHFAPYADFFSNDDTDFDGVIEFLESKVEVMRDRVKTNKSRTGESNFWLTPTSPEQPAEVIVMDEVQNWTDSTGDSKEVKAQKQRIVSLLTNIAKKGRSAGFTLIASTQKPDSQSLPTALRDVCTRRISFRLTTREMTQMVLGMAPDDAPDPTEIPNGRKGGAVMANDEGEWEMVRAYFFPEKALESWLSENCGHRHAPEMSGNSTDVI